MSLRIKLIQFLIQLNEQLIFYPRLAAYYKSAGIIKEPVIFDIGANKGQTIHFFLKLFPGAVIYAFEPNCRLYKKLTLKYGHLPNVHLINKGVSNQNGSLAFKETAMDETSTFEEFNYGSGYLKMKSKVLGIKPENMVVDIYEVDVIKLSDFIVDKRIQHIHVMKIDTEGHELKCLQGLFSSQNIVVDIFQLEQHNDDMYFNGANEDDALKLLKTNGFSLHKKNQSWIW